MEIELALEGTIVFCYNMIKEGSTKLKNSTVTFRSIPLLESEPNGTSSLETGRGNESLVAEGAIDPRKSKSILVNPISILEIGFGSDIAIVVGDKL